MVSRPNRLLQDSTTMSVINKIAVRTACKYHNMTAPLLISTGFLKHPLELKKISVRTEKKIQLVYN